MIYIKQANKIDWSENIIDCLKNPLPKTILVLENIHQSSKKIIAKILKHTTKITTQLSDQEIRQSIRNFLISNQIEYPTECIQILSQIPSENLQKELEKIYLYTYQTKKITLSELEKMNLKPSLDWKVFDYIDAITATNKKMAYTIIHQLCQNQNQITSLIGILAWHFHRIWYGIIWLQKKQSLDTFCIRFKIKRWQKDKIKRQIYFYQKRYQHLINTINYLLDLDKEIKTGTPLQIKTTLLSFTRYLHNTIESKHF